jgi:hypothetical protein
MGTETISSVNTSSIVLVPYRPPMPLLGVAQLGQNPKVQLCALKTL